MLAWLLALLPLHGLWRLARRPSPWPRRFLGGIARIAGARVALSGTPAPAPVLYLANHQSWLDIMVLAGATGTAFVSKAEVARWPLFGWLAALNRTIFVARDDRSGVRGQADALRSALEAGQPVALFPEGTIHPRADGSGLPLLPFRASLLAAAVPPPPGLAIQPVAIAYRAGADNIAWAEEPVGRNVWRILGRRGRFEAELSFLPPLPRLADRKAIARKAGEAVEAALAARGAASGYPPAAL